MSFDSHLIAQLIGLLACLTGVTAFMQRSDGKLRAQLTLNGVLMALHFFLLGGTAVAINCLLCAVRTWVSGRTRHLAIMLGFILLTLVLTLPQVTHPMQWLTIAGTTLSTYALFRLEGLALRLCMLSSSTVWLLHNVWAGSWGGVLLEGVFFVVNSITIVRLYQAQRRDVLLAQESEGR